MSNITQTLKGFRDFLPQIALQRQWLKDKLVSIFEAWGYDPLETPTLEPLALFRGKIGEDEKLFYQFQDRGKREVALRYDQTVPACRVIAQYRNLIPLPFKRYQIQPAFRQEKPQAGRYREFLQADADIFGVASWTADAELIALSLYIYKTLGFPKYKVLVNDRALLQNIPYPVLVEIDKLKKIGEELVLKNIQAKGFTFSQAKDYLSLVKNLKPSKILLQIFKYLQKCGFSEDNFVFSPTLSRSFSYSTGPIWEVEIPGYDVGSVLGGERFDNLVKDISGQAISGTGFGLGFDRTLEAACQFNLAPTIKSKTKILVTVFSKDYFPYSLKISQKLRQAKLNCELYPDYEVKLEKQLKYANLKGIPLVIIIGPKEKEIKKVLLKNMDSGKQQLLDLEQLIKNILS